MLSAGLILRCHRNAAAGAGDYLPGQELSFRSPVRIGDTITATVTIRSLNPERNRAELDTVCTNQDGVQVVTGTAKVMPPKV